MHIREAYGHKVQVILNNGNELIDNVLDYENPFETDSGNYDMDLETDIGIYSIDESEIKEIKLIY